MMIPSVAVSQPPADDISFVTRAELKSELNKISGQIAALGTQPSASPSLEDRVAALERNQRDIVRTQHNQGTAIGQIAARDEAGNYYWQFDANSQPARDEFKKAVRRTMPNWGTLIVSNRTPFGYWIAVNNRYRYIQGGDTEYFDVKPGTVTTQLENQQPISWLIGLPNYLQAININ
jgi:hypothetical protein